MRQSREYSNSVAGRRARAGLMALGLVGGPVIAACTPAPAPSPIHTTPPTTVEMPHKLPETADSKRVHAFARRLAALAVHDETKSASKPPHWYKHVSPDKTATSIGFVDTSSSIFPRYTVTKTYRYETMMGIDAAGRPDPPAVEYVTIINQEKSADTALSPSAVSDHTTVDMITEDQTGNWTFCREQEDNNRLCFNLDPTMVSPTTDILNTVGYVAVEDYIIREYDRHADAA